MTPPPDPTGRLELPEGHEARGPIRCGDVSLQPGDALDVLARARPAPGEGAAEFFLPLEGAGLGIRLDGPLAAAFRSVGEDPAGLVRQAFERLPDRALLAPTLSGRRWTGYLLDASFHAVEDHRRNGLFGLSRALFQGSDPVVRRILLQVALIHQLRHEALASPKLSGGELERSLLKMDAGLFLLLLTDHRRKVFFLPRILKEVDAVIAPESGFRDVLVPILARLPFVQADDPAESPTGIPFLNGNAFDALAPGQKLQVILGGVLAWYTVLSLGLLRPFAGLFRRLTPFFDPAWRMLRHSFKEGFLVKRGFMGRAVRAALRGNLPEGVEFFWSGWNPVLVRVAVRPLYRLLGGNRWPVAASVGTFLYTAAVVHLLWFAAAVLGAFRLASLADPGFTAGARIGANGHFVVLGCAVGAYGVFGLLSGVSKALRARRRNRARGRPAR